MNISGCDCVPKDCQQTSVAFQQLQQSTEHCFIGNYPINDIANKILEDARYLRIIIQQLNKQNPQSQNNLEVEYSFNSKTIENTVKVENKWCNY